MLYYDRIYGKAEIDDPAILELIKSPALKRLKGIDQTGYFEPHYPGTAHSRFEHSLGVCLLLKNYGAPREEQIAGLIHDVSHSAFSHCVDYALDAGSEENQSYQDDIFEKFVMESEIPFILEKHGLDIERIIDGNNFPLLEKDLPDICADRIDYSLRGAAIFKEIKDAGYFINRLRAENGRWIFNDFTVAKEFAELFLKMSSVYYAGLPSAVMFRTVGDYLRRALAEKYITEADLYATDRIVLKKIGAHLGSDPELRRLFDRMNGRVGYKNDPGDYDMKVALKSRAVDPLFREGKEVKRVSDAEPDWKKIVEQERKPKVYYLKFER